MITIPQMHDVDEPGVSRREAIEAHVRLLFDLVAHASKEEDKQAVRREIDKYLAMEPSLKANP